MRGKRMWAELALMMCGYLVLWFLWFAFLRFAEYGWITSGFAAAFLAVLSIGFSVIGVEVWRSRRRGGGVE